VSNETLIFHDAQPSHIQAWLLEPLPTQGNALLVMGWKRGYVGHITTMFPSPEALHRMSMSACVSNCVYREVPKLHCRVSAANLASPHGDAWHCMALSYCASAGSVYAI